MGPMDARCLAHAKRDEEKKKKSVGMRKKFWKGKLSHYPASPIPMSCSAPRSAIEAISEKGGREGRSSE